LSTIDQHTPSVSVVVPAHDAEATLPETLESLLRQTTSDWEAIVVDDGSTDGTAAVAADYQSRDPRIKLLHRPAGGVSAARNAGIEQAQAEWLLFLDADDWLVDSALERLLQAVQSDASARAAYSGSVRVDVDGQGILEQRGGRSGDLFPEFARTCFFPVHAALLPRVAVVESGGFETELRVCEEWDLFQRIARTGIRFAAVEEPLAVYRVRPSSASMDGDAVTRGGLETIERGHAADPRVRRPDASHAAGEPRDALPDARVAQAMWGCGLAIAHGRDPLEALALVDDDLHAALALQSLVDPLLGGILVGLARPYTALPETWPTLEGQVGRLLDELEARSGAQLLARRLRRLLERHVATMAPALPVRVGDTTRVVLDVTEEIADLAADGDRLLCDLTLHGRSLGSFEVAAADGLVPAAVVRDCIAGGHAWQILDAFLRETLADELAQRPGITKRALRSGDGRVPWTLFLQELWARPWELGFFYDTRVDAQAWSTVEVDDTLVFEASAALPDVQVSGLEVTVRLTVGGGLVGSFALPGKRHVPAQELLVGAVNACGFELARVAVREVLVGRPFDGPRLRQRLWEESQRKGIADRVPAAISPRSDGVVFARRPGVIGTSVSRYAALPAEVWPELADAARIAGETVVQVTTNGDARPRVVYSPEVVVGTPRDTPAVVPAPREDREPRPLRPDDRARFEEWFAGAEDPWDYTNEYEEAKYAQTLSLLPEKRPASALEIGCAEGHFTARLAERVDALVAADISLVALERAKERCADRPNVSFVQLDVARDALPGPVDLIVCSELLYYLLPEELAPTVGKLVEALEPGGYLLSAHPNLAVDGPERPAFAWGHSFGGRVIRETFAQVPELRLLEEIRTPLYSIQLLQREPRLSVRHPEPQIHRIDELPPLPENVARNVLWNGAPEESVQPPEDQREPWLPILAYHRIAAGVGGAPGRFCVDPGDFEQQLRYLRDAGYHSVGLDDWRAAVGAWRPLPGRPVLISFDDGYRDFLTDAWPLLEQYGFRALVFVVAGEVGATNRWDERFAEQVPLLDWPEIERLAREGVEFGSHSVSHRSLTGLSVEDVVREAARSRATLEQRLGRVEAFAYPYGDVDPAIAHLIGACGYTYGLTTRGGTARATDWLLDLPRIIVWGNARFEEFVRSLQRQPLAG
jgi:peptidoglycan/xylan/chitin deacetylase (PgdA/CDA1 family)